MGVADEMALLLTEAQVDSLLTMPMAIAAVEKGFRLLGEGEAENYPRQRGGRPGAVLNVMWAVAPPMRLMAVKSYPVVRSDVAQSSTSTLVLYGLPEGRVQGILEADILGQRRTGATTAVATRLMARNDSQVVTVFGAGWQARGQVEALVEVLPNLSRVLVVNRDSDRARKLTAELEEMGLAAEPTDTETGVRRGDVIVTATGATDPLFKSEWVRPGTHINAVGSNYREKAEIDGAVIRLAAVVAVDSLEVARLESGDLLRAEHDFGTVVELADIVVGKRPSRTSSDDVTIFESQGLAIEDLVCGDVVLREAADRGEGMELPI
jgi:ornithine cyclodeaminase/alanine dehydrogenase-like protein (mu-crystallin family)